MANDLSAIMPKILARGLMVLRSRCVMPRLVNGDYSVAAAERGDTIDVPIPTAVATRNVAPSYIPPASVDIATSKVQVTLDNWKQNDPIHLTDKDLVEIDRNVSFIPMQLGEAISGLANDVNADIMAEYKKVYGWYGSAGVTPFGSGVDVASATGARKILNKQGVPLDNRRGVLNFDAEASALALASFANAEKVMSNDVVINGEVGRKYGIDWFADDAVPTHTAGTLTDGASPTPTHTCASAKGSQAAVGTYYLNVDAGSLSTLTGTVVVGDIITFAGHSQTYVIVASTQSSAQYNSATETYTAAVNAIAKLEFYPALVHTVENDEVITLKQSHTVNLVFHRDAFAFATRPLVSNTMDLSLGSQILSMQDPYTGLTLRLEVSRQHKQVAWEFDILWGAKLVRPELAMRLVG